MTKEAQKKECQRILYGYNVGESIQQSDTNFLLSVFEGHDRWEMKRGSGVDFVTVEYSSYGNGNKCFVIHRIDGSKTDISFVHAITNKTPIFDIKKACRTAITDEINEFRKSNVIYYVTRCPITGTVLTPENTHIDHYDLEFNDLFNKWVANYDLKYLSARINETEDMSDITCFTDPDIISDFKIFHSNNTHLRAVTKVANLSILKTIKI
jgi:hypothetical protein